MKRKVIALVTALLVSGSVGAYASSGTSFNRTLSTAANCPQSAVTKAITASASSSAEIFSGFLCGTGGFESGEIGKFLHEAGSNNISKAVIPQLPTRSRARSAGTLAQNFVFSIRAAGKSCQTRIPAQAIRPAFRIAAQTGQPARKA